MKTLLEYIKRGTKQVEKGVKKYGGTLDEKDLSVVELIDHAVEEHVDAIFYMLKLREKLEDEEVSDKEAVKNCGNCKYHTHSFLKIPCYSCGNEHQGWQPKEGSE